MTDDIYYDIFAHDRGLRVPAAPVAVTTHCHGCGAWLPAQPTLWRGGTLCSIACAERWQQQLDRR